MFPVCEDTDRGWEDGIMGVFKTLTSEWEQENVADQFKYKVEGKANNFEGQKDQPDQWEKYKHQQS